MYGRDKPLPGTGTRDLAAVYLRWIPTRRWTMRRGTIRAVLLSVTTVAVGSLGTVPAVAGGGCHASLTDGTGGTVAMTKACFRPAILRIDPGTEVTFVNRDPLTHNVSSNGWGRFDDMNQGDAFRATFAEPGIYPFACTLHPGMVGAVVVGEDNVAGSGKSVSISAVSDTDPPPSAGAVERASEGKVEVWLGGGILAGAIGAVGVILAIRRRPQTVSGAS
jgi:plastocyanin